MKKNFLLMLAVILLLTLACRVTIDTSTSPSTDEGSSFVATSVAQTIEARTVNNTPTLTALPTPTSTETATPSPTATATSYIYGWHHPPCHDQWNNAEYVDDITIPNGTVLAPGQVFIKTWKVLNTGDSIWTIHYLLVPVSGKVMGGSTAAIGQVVYPGHTAAISVVLQAPNAEGIYKGYWQMADENDHPFGDTLPIKIIVMVTPTATATATNTPIPTLTSAWTAIPGTIIP